MSSLGIWLGRAWQHGGGGGGNTPRAVYESSPGVPKHKRQTRQHTPGPTALGKHATGILSSLPQHRAVQGRQLVQVPTQMLLLPGRPPSLPLPPTTPRAIQNHVAVSWRKGFGEYVRSTALLVRRPSPGKKIKRKRGSGRIPVSSPHS